MPMFSGKTLLVTGGKGSFGNAVLERFIKTNFAEIRIFGRDEKKQEDMRLALKDNRLKFSIGDVRDNAAVNDAVRGTDYIFHAAALKHVPSMPTDYEPCNVSDKMLRIVQSYTEFVNQRVWKKTN